MQELLDFALAVRSHIRKSDATVAALAFDWIIFACAAVYLDQVVPNAFGRRQPPWYLFTPTYWGHAKPPTADTSTDVSDEGHAYDDDVLREQERVLAGTDAESDAIRVVNLCKRFGNPKRGWSFTAVHKINFCVKHDQLCDNEHDVNHHR